MIRIKRILFNILKLAKFNMRIIFAGKFVYFVLAAFLFFLVFGITIAFENWRVEPRNVYDLLVLPALLLVFYPSVFGIQNDADQRTLEIIFGIPDYRYKVWLVRFVMVLIVVTLLLFPFAGISYWILVSFPFMKLLLHLMVLVCFISTFGFAISTIVKNGNAAAVIVVVFSLLFLILSEELDESKWNVFLNPFKSTDMNEILWTEIITQNRLLMGGFSILFLLIGLLNLQKRERFL